MKGTACALAAWAVLLVRIPVARADPAAACRAERSGDRAEAKVQLSGLFDEELLHLVRLGLRGQIHVQKPGLLIVGRGVPGGGCAVVGHCVPLMLCWI